MTDNHAMTLEQVRDQLRGEVERIERDRMKYDECAYRTPSATLDDLADAIDAHLAHASAQPASEVRVDCPLVGFVDRDFSKSSADFGEICKVQDKRFAIPVYREVPSTQPASVGDEWMTVPREPTPEMIEAGNQFTNRDDWGPHHDGLSAIWNAMIAAAPQPPSA